MYLPFTFAITSAAAVGVIALSDALMQGITGTGLLVLIDDGHSGWYFVIGLVHALMYAAIAWLLHDNAARIDDGSRARRATRRLLVAMTVISAALEGVFFPLLSAMGMEGEPWFEVLTMAYTLLFVLLFLLAFVLGIMLRKVPGMHTASGLLMSAVPILLVTTIVAAAGEPLAGFAHPAYTEIAAYIGLALTGLNRTTVSRFLHESESAPLGRVRAVLPHS